MGSEALLDAISIATSAVRSRHVPVVYVWIGFRNGTPEISNRNRTLSAIASSGGLPRQALPARPRSTQIHPAIAPHPEEIAVTKRRVGAFGSDLDMVSSLSLDVHSLVLCGIATSDGVLSTLRQPADFDYQLTVLPDACVDSDPEVHRVLMDNVLFRQAMVVDTTQWVK